MSSITLCNIKAKIHAFYKCKFKDNNTAIELAMLAGRKLKGQCYNCGKQGHKAFSNVAARAMLQETRTKGQQSWSEMFQL